MNSQWNTVLFWLSAILIMVVATVVYQPAAAKTGSLLVWTRNRVYIMDIDTLELERVGPATPEQTVSPSPGCLEPVAEFCWVAIDHLLYRLELGGGGSNITTAGLPLEVGFRWAGQPPSWSPDGVHLAYYLLPEGEARAELRVVDVTTGQVQIKAQGVDPEIPVAWSPECTAGLVASGCRLGYKQIPAPDETLALPALVGYTPATNEIRHWAISPEPIFELRWSAEGSLLYSRPKRHFLKAEDHTPVSELPPGAKLANHSPDGRYTVYYLPFTLKECQESEIEAGQCLHLGVWLAQAGQAEADLIYTVDLAEADQTSGLNFIPTWSPSGQSFVFFQGGRLIHYNLPKKEATIWYKSLSGKLRSLPVFSPTEEAVAFVDDQGQGLSDYRLLVIDPKLEPVNEIIQAEGGFKILAWLPN